MQRKIKRRLQLSLLKIYIDIGNLLSICWVEKFFFIFILRFFSLCCFLITEKDVYFFDLVFLQHFLHILLPFGQMFVSQLID